MGLSTTVAFAQRKAAVPQGYEEAAPAGARPLAGRAGAAAEGQSLLEALTDALGAKVDPNVLKLEQQYRPQFQQLLTAELAFVRRTCEPERGQLREVAVAAQGRLGTALRDFAVAQNQMQRGRVRRPSDVQPDPRRLIQQQVATIVKAKLRPEQAQGYEKECKNRKERRKRAVVLNLVAKVDEELMLTADQREQLVVSFTENYQEDWDQWLRMLMHNANYVPSIRDDSVLPVLNDKQKEVWRQIPKTSRMIFGGIELAAGVVIDDAELEEFGNDP